MSDPRGPGTGDGVQPQAEKPTHPGGGRDDIYNSDEEHHGKGGTMKDEGEELEDQFKIFISEVKKGNAAKVREILQKATNRNEFINKIDAEDRKTAVISACLVPNEDNALETLKVLLDFGANINYKDGLKQTGLYYLARDGKSKVVEFYLSRGGSPDETDTYGQSPLYYAAREGKFATTKLLADNGANVNKVDSFAQTPLFYAAREGHYEICKYLLEKGANVNQIDNNKYTPLYWAKKSNHQQVADLFIANGAINTKNGKVTDKDLQKYAKVGPVKNPPSSTGVVDPPRKLPEEKGITPQPFEEVSKEAEIPGAQVRKPSSVMSQPSSLLKKKKREKEESKIAYRLVYTDQNGVSKELTAADFEKFKQDYPDIAQLITNPDQLIGPGVIADSLEKESWQKNAKKILNILWKQRGAYIFHAPVDPVKLNIPDYFDIIKVPMDFGTIKTRLNANLYATCKEWIDDMLQYQLKV